MAEKVQIWHNSRCSKSRDAFQWLAEKGFESEWIDYMKNPVSSGELALILKKLSISAFDLIRKKEKLFLENWKNQEKTEKEWIEIMIKNPQLIERPIVIKGNKAIIARPLELIEQLFI
jgi:arsenate reductase|tara:strand:+ start:1816 stop:2169 length:354 start_codon:yes stop_codon:yes gene_type:complete